MILLKSLWLTILLYFPDGLCRHLLHIYDSETFMPHHTITYLWHTILWVLWLWILKLYCYDTFMTLYLLCCDIFMTEHMKCLNLITLTFLYFITALYFYDIVQCDSFMTCYSVTFLYLLHYDIFMTYCIHHDIFMTHHVRFKHLVILWYFFLVWFTVLSYFDNCVLITIIWTELDFAQTLECQIDPLSDFLAKQTLPLQKPLTFPSST